MAKNSKALRRLLRLAPCLCGFEDYVISIDNLAYASYKQAKLQIPLKNYEFSTISFLMSSLLSIHFPPNQHNSGWLLVGMVLVGEENNSVFMIDTVYADPNTWHAFDLRFKECYDIGTYNLDLSLMFPNRALK